MPDYHKNSNLLNLQKVKLQWESLGRKLHCEIVGKNHIILLAEEGVYGVTFCQNMHVALETMEARLQSLFFLSNRNQFM